MQRYHQGQLDFFCAVYAVVNAINALYTLSLAQVRALFATILADISKYPDLWQATLLNETDFHWLAAHMLLACGRGNSYPVRVFRPFHPEREIPPAAASLENARLHLDLMETNANPPDPDAIWAALDAWLPETRVQPRAGSARQVAILRFHRYMRHCNEPVVSHWTVADHRHSGLIHLRDASREENALYSLDRDQTVFHPQALSAAACIRIEPESIYFVARG